MSSASPPPPPRAAATSAAQAKWLTGSVTADSEQVIQAVFDQAEQRDPTADAWRQWETGATHPRVDRLFRLGAVATQHALTATSHHNGVQVLCDLAALGPTGLAAAIGALGQQTGDTPTQLAARIGVDPVSVRGWIAGRSTPQLAHLVGLGKLRRPTSPPT